MPPKRTRNVGELPSDVEMKPVEISSSVGASNTMVRSARMIGVPPPTPPPSPQPQRAPLQIKFTEGGGFKILPPTYLYSCNYCSKTIGSNEDRYMNGGLEAYCSPRCRESFNNLVEENVEPSLDSGLPSRARLYAKEEEEYGPMHPQDYLEEDFVRLPN